MGNDWQMPRRGEACEGCRRSFEPGETIQAYLYEWPEGYQRRDYCATCQPPDAAFAIGSWKTRRPEPVAKKAPTFDRQGIYRFFEQLEEADTPEKRQLRFVLALLLWRKKLLKLDRSETGDGVETWHFVVARTDVTHAVTRPELDEEELERLGSQLEALLAGEVNELSTLVSNSDEDHNEVSQPDATVQ